MGVSLVRVGDSRERGRGRGQGVSAINGRSSTGPLPPQTLGKQRQITCSSAISAPTGEKDNTAAILFRGTKDSNYRRHFCWRTKTYNTTPPFCSYGKKQTNMHWCHFAVVDTYMQDIARRSKKHISLALA